MAARKSTAVDGAADAGGVGSRVEKPARHLADVRCNGAVRVSGAKNAAAADHVRGAADGDSAWL